jgi:hypothetical protein
MREAVRPDGVRGRHPSTKGVPRALYPGCAALTGKADYLVRLAWSAGLGGRRRAVRPMRIASTPKINASAE